MTILSDISCVHIIIDISVCMGINSEQMCTTLLRSILFVNMFCRPVELLDQFSPPNLNPFNHFGLIRLHPQHSVLIRRPETRDQRPGPGPGPGSGPGPGPSPPPSGLLLPMSSQNQFPTQYSTVQYSKLYYIILYYIILYNIIFNTIIKNRLVYHMIMSMQSVYG